MSDEARFERSDRRVVWPRVKVTIEGLGEVELYYRNRDLEELEARYGTLEGFERATEETPFTALPVALWLGLRHAKDAPTLDDLRDLPPRATIADEVQEAVEDALLAALGMTREEAERKLAEVDPTGAGEEPAEDGGPTALSGAS